MATKALSHTGSLQHHGTFICYAWPQRPSATQAHYSITAVFFCYAWPQRPSATQADYSMMTLLFVMHGHKGPQPHRLITASRHFYLLCMATKALSHTGLLQHNGSFICYAWPQRPSATQADYSITAVLFVMHGHKGPQPHRLITA